MHLNVTKGFDFLMSPKYLVKIEHDALTMFSLVATIRVHYNSMKCVLILTNLLLTLTVNVWCTQLYVEMVVYSGIDTSANMLCYQLVNIVYTNIIRHCSILMLSLKSAL